MTSAGGDMIGNRKYINPAPMTIPAIKIFIVDEIAFCFVWGVILKGILYAI